MIFYALLAAVQAVDDSAPIFHVGPAGCRGGTAQLHHGWTNDPNGPFEYKGSVINKLQPRTAISLRLPLCRSPIRPVCVCVRVRVRARILEGPAASFPRIVATQGDPHGCANSPNNITDKFSLSLSLSPPPAALAPFPPQMPPHVSSEPRRQDKLGWRRHVLGPRSRKSRQCPTAPTHPPPHAPPCPTSAHHPCPAAPSPQHAALASSASCWTAPKTGSCSQPPTSDSGIVIGSAHGNSTT